MHKRIKGSTHILLKNEKFNYYYVDIYFITPVEKCNLIRIFKIVKLDTRNAIEVFMNIIYTSSKTGYKIL